MYEYITPGHKVHLIYLFILISLNSVVLQHQFITSECKVHFIYLFISLRNFGYDQNLTQKHADETFSIPLYSVLTFLFIT